MKNRYEVMSKADYIIYTSPVKSSRQRELELKAQQKMLLFCNDPFRYNTFIGDNLVFDVYCKDKVRCAEIPDRPGIYNLHEWYTEEHQSFCCIF